MTEIGAVELGGTKTLVAVGSPAGELGEVRQIVTGDGESTLDTVAGALSGGGLSAIGVAAFGPLELRPGHPLFGRVLSTPKAGWSGTDVVGHLTDRLGLPIAIDTDVNAAAVGEGRLGAAAGLANHVYITAGTGIGVGIVVDHRVHRGLSHPEAGHMVVNRHPSDDHQGSCPFHGDCLEGMASGPAVAARFGTDAYLLRGSAADEAVDLVTFYLAQGLRNLVYTLAPERFVIGGGLSKMEGFHRRVRAHLDGQLAGYGAIEEYGSSGFVVEPGLGDRSGLTGALLLGATVSD
jgi:fructokinase